MTPEERTDQYLKMITDKNGELWISPYKLEVMLNNIQKEAIAEEREACAKIAEPKECSNSLLYDVRVSIAQVIRARGEK